MALSVADIIRLEESPECILGTLRLDRRLMGYTIERTSTKVPVGLYLAHRYKSPANKAVVWLLNDVPGMTYVEIHIANRAWEVKGCFGLGLDLGEIGNDRAVRLSASCFKWFMKETEDKSSLLINVMELY